MYIYYIYTLYIVHTNIHSTSRDRYTGTILFIPGKQGEMAGGRGGLVLRGAQPIGGRASLERVSAQFGPWGHGDTSPMLVMSCIFLGGGVVTWSCTATTGRGGRSVDERRLLQGEEHRTHARHVLGLLAGLGAEVAEASHALPLRSRVRVVVANFGSRCGLLSRPEVGGRGGDRGPGSGGAEDGAPPGLTISTLRSG